MKKYNQLKLVRVLTLAIIISLFIFNPLIVQAEATDVSISGTKTMKVGGTQTLTTEIKKDDPDTDTNTYKLLFSSTNTDVATVDENGTITAIKGGTTSIVVQIENTSIQKTFEIVVEEEQVIEPVLSSDNTLKSLSIDGYEFDKKFDKDETKYEITVPSGTKSLKVKYDANHLKAGVQVTGNNSISDGSTIRVVVTAEDKTSKTYEIKVNYEKINLNLSSIKVLGQSLNETFKSSQTRYTLTVAYEITALSIDAKPESSDAKVEVSGNDNLDVGTNTVTITVRGKTGNDKKVYTIIVTREKETNNNKTDTSNSSTITSEDQTTSSTPNSNKTTPSTTNGGSNMAKYVLVTIGCLVLFAIGGVGVYFYIKTAEPKNKKKGKNKQKEIPTKRTEPEIDTEEEYQTGEEYNYEEVSDYDLEDTKEFNREELTTTASSRSAQNNSRYDDDVLKDIEDLFED